MPRSQRSERIRVSGSGLIAFANCLLAGLAICAWSASFAANGPPPPSDTLHGYYWKHIAFATTAIDQDIQSASIEANTGTTTPPLAAIGTAEGVEIFAYKRLFFNLPLSWKKEATLVGTYVSLSGNRLAIGQPGLGGDVRVYERSSSGQWTQLGGNLFPPVAALTEPYGRSVDLEGNRLVVGMPHPVAGTGKAFIYDFVDGQWQTSTVLVGDATQADSGRKFGADVSLSGNVVAVGEAKDGSSGQGRVHLYRLDGGAWSLMQTLSGRDPANPAQPSNPNDPSAEDFAATLILRRTQLGVRSSGYLQMFEQVGTDAPWTYRETFNVESDYLEWDQRSVAFDGVNLLAGEPQAGGDLSGRVRPLLGPLGGAYMPVQWSFVLSDHRIKEPTPQMNSYFGRVTAVDDNWLVIAGNQRVRFYQKTAY